MTVFARLCSAQTKIGLFHRRPHSSIKRFLQKFCAVLKLNKDVIPAHTVTFYGSVIYVLRHYICFQWGIDVPPCRSWNSDQPKC